MKRHNLKFFQHLWRKSRDAMVRLSKRIAKSIKDGMRVETANATRRHGSHQPSGDSFRSLRRAFNQGWMPPVIEEKALLRHAWYRRKLAWTALREKLGQA